MVLDEPLIDIRLSALEIQRSSGLFPGYMMDIATKEYGLSFDNLINPDILNAIAIADFPVVRDYYNLTHAELTCKLAETKKCIEVHVATDCIFLLAFSTQSLHNVEREIALLNEKFVKYTSYITDILKSKEDEDVSKC